MRQRLRRAQTLAEYSLIVTMMSLAVSLQLFTVAQQVREVYTCAAYVVSDTNSYVVNGATYSVYGPLSRYGDHLGRGVSRKCALSPCQDATKEFSRLWLPMMSSACSAVGTSE